MSQEKQLYESALVWDQELQLGQKNLVQAIKDFLSTDIETVLDVGCGDGKVTSAIIKATGKSVVGLDFSEEALSRCMFDTIHGDATALPFADTKFDLVMTLDMLEHLPDDIEEKAWQQLFRVAAKSVMVAVPFREELLDATALCTDCGKTYHVNWHQRSYDIAALHRRAPQGWHVQASVISGETWPDVLPAETQLRRLALGEWSGWTKAVCSHCGASGREPTPHIPIPSLTAAALGQQVYAALESHRIWRSHSEILIIFGRNQSFTPPTLPRPVTLDRLSTLAEPAIQVRHENLVTYPQVARQVRAVDGGMIVQFPAYGVIASLTIQRIPGTSAPVEVRLEDGLGVLYAGLLLQPDQAEATICLARPPVPGMYGILLRVRSLDAISSVQLGVGPKVSWASPGESLGVGYHRFGSSDPALFVQITGETWLDDSFLMPFVAGSGPALYDLFSRIEVLAAQQQAYLTHEADRLAVALQNLTAEKESLLLRAHEANRLAVEVQNLTAEKEALVQRAHEADRLAVEVQNLIADRNKALRRP